jgi:hypothetical protein
VGEVKAGKKGRNNWISSERRAKKGEAGGSIERRLGMRVRMYGRRKHGGGGSAGGNRGRSWR